MQIHHTLETVGLFVVYLYPFVRYIASTDPHETERLVSFFPTDLPSLVPAYYTPLHVTFPPSLPFFTPDLSELLKTAKNKGSVTFMLSNTSHLVTGRAGVNVCERTIDRGQIEIPDLELASSVVFARAEGTSRFNVGTLGCEEYEVGAGCKKIAGANAQLSVH